MELTRTAWLGDRAVVRIFAKHEPYSDGHLGKVAEEMLHAGAPVIRCVEWRGNLYALEGSHRLAAAWHYGLVPIFVVEVPDRFSPEDEAFWETVKTTLPHYAWLRPNDHSGTDAD